MRDRLDEPDFRSAALPRATCILGGRSLLVTAAIEEQAFAVTHSSRGPFDMSGPRSSWGRMIAAGTSMGRSGQGTVSMLDSAQAVIAARTGLMAAALTSPLTADHVELARMAPEKVDAFSRAGLAASTVWLDYGSAWLRCGQDVTAMMLRGRPPTPGEATQLFSRWSNLMLSSVETAARLGAVTLAPLHKQVRSNARRLRSGPRTASGKRSQQK